MYTRCPSCRSEISFELPANLDTASLPENYRHRIKCPCCGVTIGVKINRIDTSATYPNYNNFNNSNTQKPQPAATAFEPVNEQFETYQQQTTTTTTTVTKKTKSAARADKKSGVGRNITVMIFSLLFVALCAVGYLINQGTIKIPENLMWLDIVRSCDGINLFDTLINDFEGFKNGIALIEGAANKTVLLLSSVVPAFLFVLAGINFIVAFIAACGKKYPRAWNLISGILIAGCLILLLFIPFIQGVKLVGIKGDLIGYFQDVINGTEYFSHGQNYLLYAFAGVGFLYLIISLCFCASLKKKHN